ncbi:TonB-dependent receptor [Pelomonas cellulosilytica]|uniref:TonB-dependent receptor n=1 Tax=Pelomonas cellulosilytica TaxID=2906762 RepID=A0ABS8XTS7_9BURK|nr:TonB-dependent receptor [Pelomonas sp. P8]MCE4554613.1 TonB-dependent receptor [Pelomonas sp. P8]
MPAFRPSHRPALSPVALAVALASLPAASAWAQAEPAAAADKASQQLETVTITGIRASLASALNKKREESGIVDVVRAEDIGKFPDTNLAESLQRVPGVVIDRDAGEGRQITVRGLGGDFTRTRINGIEGLATTGGTDSSGGNNRSRTMDFNVFASELFQQITVRKSQSADVDEGSLGATVDLLTSRPFDLKKGFTALASVKGSYNDLSGKTTPRAAFLVSNTFADKKLGVLLSGAYSKRNIFEEGFSTVRWDNGVSSGGWCVPQGATVATGTTLPTGSTATTCGPAAQGASRLPNTAANVAAYNDASGAANFHPRLPRYGRLTHEQERIGLTASIQARLTDRTLATLDLLYSKLDATRQEDFLETISFSRTLSQGGKPQTSVVETQYDSNGALLYGKYNNVDVRAESRFDKLSTVFKQPTLTLEHEFTDTLKFTGLIGRADSKFKNPIQTTTTLDAPNVSGYAIDFRNSDRSPAITYPFDVTQAGGALGFVGVPQNGTATSITNGTSSEIRIRPNGTNNRNDVVQLNLAWEVADGLTLKGGSSYKKYGFESYESRRSTENMYAPPAGTTAASLSKLLTGFGKQSDVPSGTPTSWVIPDLNAIAGLYDIYCNCLKSGPAGGPGDFTLTSVTNGNARGNNRAVTEVDRGWYFQADFSTRLGGIPVRGNFGTRYVKTEITATGYVATGGGTQVTVKNNYDDMLPAANVTFELSRDLLLRASAAQVMTRPTLAALNPGGTVNTTGNLSITNGNPFLKPFRAKTLDTGVEWYFQKNAMVGLGLFYKDIDSYIQQSVSTVRFKDTGLPLSLLPSNFTGDEQFALTSSFNTPGGKLKGFELSYQQPFTFLPAWGKNFGVVANYTYVTSKIAYFTSAANNTPISADLVNMSPRSWNGSLYYDDGAFSARVSLAKRSRYLQRVPGQNNNDVEGKNGTKNVDFSMSYKFNDRFDVTLEGINLTNQANDQYISSQRNSVVVNNVTGREYLVGARYKF